MVKILYTQSLSIWNNTTVLYKYKSTLTLLRDQFLNDISQKLPYFLEQKPGLKYKPGLEYRPGV